MKRRIITILAVLTLLVTALAVAAQAATIPTDVDWIELSSKEDFLEWFSGTTKSKHLTDGYTAGMTRYYKLTEDITIDENSTVWYLSSGTYAVNVYFDLNGHTLTYASPNTPATRLFGSYNANCMTTVVNGTITNRSALYDSNGGIFFMSVGSLTVEDVVFNDLDNSGNSSNRCGRMIYVTANNTLTITDCTFNADAPTKAGYGLLVRSECPATITNCTFTSKGTGTTGYGGFAYLGGSGVTHTLTDCTFTGGSAAYGGAIYSVNSNLILENCTFDGGHAVTEGGNILQKNGSITITNSTIKNGTSGSIGGNLSIANAAKLYFKSGSIENGSAVNGGNIADSVGGASGPTLNIQGGTISGGTATTSGGNIYLAPNASYAGKPTLNIQSGTITGGSAGKSGGNICLSGLSGKLVTMTMTGGTIGGEPAQGADYSGSAVDGGNFFGTYATVTISGGTVSHGYASSLGGNLYPSAACTLNVTGGTVANGVTQTRGGNMYISSTNTVVNISGGTLKNGVAMSQGGNVYHGNGKLTITGGVITGGTASTDGGNIYSAMGYGDSATASGRLTIQDDGDAATPLPQITNGTADTGIGGNIYIACSGNEKETGANKATLGNFQLSGGKAGKHGNDLFISRVTDLEILPEFSQDITAYIDEGLLPATGDNVLNADRVTTTGDFTGKLILEQGEHPYVYAREGSTNLYLTTAAVKSGEDVVWYESNEEAVQNAAAGAILQAGSGELVLTGGDYTVDLAGNTVAITGTGNVTVFDSANDTFELYGSATIDGPTLVNEKLQTVNGKQYYTLAVAGTYTFHRVELTLITASLRPSIGGIYYTGRWSCDEAIKPHIGNFGVAASIVSMPEKDFADLVKPTSKWTVFEAADFESGITKTGVMISGILKDAADNVTPDRIAMNAEYGQKKVHAVAYLNIDGVNYVGGGLSYSLYDILKIVSDNIEDYADKAETVQSFMTHWSANGLVGEPWDSLNFQVDPALVQLQKLYAGTTAYHGELHDHADTGGTSDGKQPLTVWKEELGKLKMDFAAIVDHRQSAHMYLPDWDNAIFIGGSEAATTITDRTGVKLHYNMIFSDPAGLEAVVSSFPEFGWQYYSEDYTGTNAAKLAGGWHFNYPNFTAARFTEVCEAVYANGGFVSLVHPKSEGYISSEDPADAYFLDGMGIEVFYTYFCTRDDWKTQENYKLWKGMMDAGYKVYATAGNDEHAMPSDKAVSVIYSAERQASAWVEQLRAGTFTAGGVGVRTVIGQTVMGGTTSFAGQRLGLSVGDFHESLYDPTHTYRVDIVTDKGVAYSQEISCTDTFYYAMDVDADAMYYYVEIFDVTENSRIAIGNPIWNADK